MRNADHALLQVLEVVVRDRLTERAAELGQHLRKGLLDLQKKHGVIGDVRGRGLLQGIEIVAPEGSPLKGDKIGALVANLAMDMGLSCNIVNLDGFAGVFRIAPPLIVTTDELDIALKIMDKAFSTVLQKLRTESEAQLEDETHKPVSLD